MTKIVKKNNEGKMIVLYDQFKYPHPKLQKKVQKFVENWTKKQQEREAT